LGLEAREDIPSLDADDVYRLGWWSGVGSFVNTGIGGVPVVVDAVTAATELWVQNGDVRSSVTGGSLGSRSSGPGDRDESRSEILDGVPDCRL
jgi:hypothetical protein